MKYQWHNYATNNNGISEFNITHHWCFEPTERCPQNKKMMQAEAERIIAYWNKVHPEIWHYALLED